MGPEVTAFLQVAIIVVVLIGALSAITVGLVRGFSRKPKSIQVGEAHSLQLEHLQHSIDAIAVEVERIAEAQRFSAKLLAERAAPETLTRLGSS